MNPEFFISTNGRKVICQVKSKGQTFRGMAICSNDDTPNLELGKRLAQCRADLQIRKRDLAEIRLVQDCLKGTIDSLPEHQSKLWMMYYQDSCRVEKTQLEHMHNLKDQIKNLCNGIIL